MDDNAKDLLDPRELTYLTDIGFWPSVHGDPDCVGDIRIGNDAYGSHYFTGSKEFGLTSFSTLKYALYKVGYDRQNPPWYNVLNNNCTDYAIELGQRVNVYTMDPTGVSTPWAFSGWLNTH